MDARVLKTFLFKSRSGKTLLTMAGLFVALVCIWYFKGRDKVEQIGASSLDSLATIAEDATESVQSISTGVPGYREEKQPVPEKKKEPRKETEESTYFPISLYSNDSLGVSPKTASYGQLIEVKLVNTVESIDLTTPIIGIVLRDIYSWDGSQIVVEANTLIHGTGSANRSRERIGASTDWILVWQDGTGRELPIKGVVLDQAIDHINGGWKPTDGSAGLKGRVIKTDRLANLKLIAASLIRGVGTGATRSELISNGNTTTQSFDGSLQNIAAQGIRDAANVYAQAILRAIQRDGFYVRVPAGKNFYVYVTQPLDTSAAYPGASLVKRDQ